MEQTQDLTRYHENSENFAFRDGNLFIIDTSPEMFETDPADGQTYFVQCLNSYGRILSQKLMWNKRDWMGLILFNVTKDWDRDPETKYILTVQKFSEVTTDMFRELMNILNNKSKKEDWVKENLPLDFEWDSSLHDVLWQACRSFDSIKISMPTRQVILLTCRDNPSINDEAERHKIRLRAKTYRDIGIKLRVVGLGDEWNHEIFYKDVDLLASNIEAENFHRTRLADLEVQVRFPARTSSQLRWRIGNDVEMRLFMKSFSAKTKYLKKARMHKDTNEILDVHTHMAQWIYDSEDEPDQDEIKTQVPDTVRKAIKRGGKLISFRPKELKDIRVTIPPGIDLIGFKPISLDLAYHIKATRFVGIETLASSEEKHLFAALLSKCEEKKLMAICSVSHRTKPYLAKLIPASQYSGFYLYRLAFREQINGLEEYTKNYMYDQDTLPITEHGMKLMSRIVKKLRMKWQPYRFSNPKLSAQLTYLEALALDVEASKQEDMTRPNKERINERLANLIEKYNEFYPPTSTSTKRAGSAKQSVAKLSKLDDQIIRALITSDTLKDATLTVLRSYARMLGVQTTGLKSQLVERITEYCARQGVEK